MEMYGKIDVTAMAAVLLSSVRLFGPKSSASTCSLYLRDQISMINLEMEGWRMIERETGEPPVNSVEAWVSSRLSNFKSCSNPQIDEDNVMLEVKQEPSLSAASNQKHECMRRRQVPGIADGGPREPRARTVSVR